VQDKKPDVELDAKFDLDIVEVPKIPVNDVEQEPSEPPDPQGQTESEKVSDTLEPKSSKKKTYLILSLAVALFLLTFSILWMTKVIRLPGTDNKINSSEFNELYMQIGPVSVNTDKIILNLTLTVKCSSVASKEKVFGMDSIIKDNLVSFLSAPDTYQIISDRDYNQLKIQMKTIINDTLGKDIIEDVYFAEIMLY